MASTINCGCHSIRSMFRVFGIYNFDGNLNTYLHKREVLQRLRYLIIMLPPSETPLCTLSYKTHKRFLNIPFLENFQVQTTFDITLLQIDLKYLGQSTFLVCVSNQYITQYDCRKLRNEEEKVSLLLTMHSHISPFGLD